MYIIIIFLQDLLLQETSRKHLNLRSRWSYFSFAHLITALASMNSKWVRYFWQNLAIKNLDHGVVKCRSISIESRTHLFLLTAATCTIVHTQHPSLKIEKKRVGRISIEAPMIMKDPYGSLVCAISIAQRMGRTFGRRNSERSTSTL